MTTEKNITFTDTLYEASDACVALASSLKDVDESINKVIASAGTLTEGVAGIFKAFEGEEVNGLALMSGIQESFAGLQGMFGGEAGSDTSELLGGLGSVGAGVAGLLTGNPLEGITSLISGLPSLIDGLTESTQEGYVKQLEKQGFNDTYSDELLDKMSEVSDQMGDKSYGMKAYIEDFFKETNIDTEEEFTRLSDLLNESIGEYVAQGHTMDEAYEKFGDELEQLTAAQEKYGFQTTASLETMIEIQKTQTKEGRIEGLTGALGGYDKIISGIEKQMKLSPDFELSGTTISGIAGSLAGAYNQLLSEGMSASDAVSAVKPLLSKYSDMAEEQGWDLSNVAGFSQLSSYFDSLDKAAGALDMIQGSAEVIDALSGSALLDQGTLSSQGSLGLDVMGQLEASGLSETQALQQMSGWLQSMQEAADKWGLTLSPEVQSLIAKAGEQGLLPEEEKPIGDVIAEGIEAGFEGAIDVIDSYFGSITEYGDGGTVPGSAGEKKLIWAHAGEYVGYPDEIDSAGGGESSGVAGALTAFVRNMTSSFNEAGTGIGVMAEAMQRLGGNASIGLENYDPARATDTQGYLMAMLQERELARAGRESAANGAVEKGTADGGSLQLAQTIENRMSLVVNDREFVQTVKNELYNQIKEDSKRGMIKIHSKAVDDY